MKSASGVLLTVFSLAVISALCGCSTWQKDRTLEQTFPKDWEEDKDRFVLNSEGRYNMLVNQYEELKGIARNMQGEQKIKEQNLLDNITTQLQQTRGELNDMRFVDEQNYFREKDQAASALSKLENAYYEARALVR